MNNFHKLFKALLSQLHCLTLQGAESSLRAPAGRLGWRTDFHV